MLRIVSGQTDILTRLCIVSSQTDILTRNTNELNNEVLHHCSTSKKIPLHEKKNIGEEMFNFYHTRNGYSIWPSKVVLCIFLIIVQSTRKVNWFFIIWLYPSDSIQLNYFAETLWYQHKPIINNANKFVFCYSLPPFPREEMSLLYRWRCGRFSGDSWKMEWPFIPVTQICVNAPGKSYPGT